MMDTFKCPKCGSKEFKYMYTRQRGHTFWRCKHCFYEPIYEEIKIIKYQRQLDRVLSVMKPYQNYKHAESYLYLIETNISIDYRNGKFYIEGEREQDSVNISLNTVESLLKDLGVIE